MRECMLAHARGTRAHRSHRRQREPARPEAGTAYQWLAMEDDKSIERKIEADAHA